jgi:ABC-2 type transport system permease protein
MLFWTLAYPVIMASLFGLAFSNINSAISFESVKIGIVDTTQYRQDTMFSSMMNSVSEGKDGKPLFSVTMYDAKEDAKAALQDGKVSGYVVEDTSLQLFVSGKGINQTISKEFLDQYIQTMSAVNRIVAANPAAAQNIQGILSQNTAYVEEAKTDTNAPNDMLIYYYALIAMSCLYGAFLGMREVSFVQANQSPQGARQHLAPVHKLKVFASSLCAVTLIQFLSILLLLGYLAVVPKVDFGNQLGYMILAAFAGCMMGVSFGALIGAVSKRKEGVKVAILISSSMTMSFLAGLMQSSVKYWAVKKVPILAYINPANLISDAYYSLYYYNTYERFFLNIGLLFAFSFLFYLIVYFIMRRQQYASI